MSNSCCVTALVLGAGRSQRMADGNKLLKSINAKTVIRHTIDNVIASDATPTIVVTGHDHQLIDAQLSSLAVTTIHAEGYAQGLSASLKTGIAAVCQSKAAGVLIVLADMPFVKTSTINAIVSAFSSHQSRPIIAPYYHAKRGNPVLWPRRFFSSFFHLDGDSGAFRLLQLHQNEVLRLAVSDPGILKDIDNQQQFYKAREFLKFFSRKNPHRN